MKIICMWAYMLTVGSCVLALDDKNSTEKTPKYLSKRQIPLQFNGLTNAFGNGFGNGFSNNLGNGLVPGLGNGLVNGLGGGVQNNFVSASGSTSSSFSNNRTFNVNNFNAYQPIQPEVPVFVPPIIRPTTYRPIITTNRPLIQPPPPIREVVRPVFRPAGIRQVVRRPAAVNTVREVVRPVSSVREVVRPAEFNSIRQVVRPAAVSSIREIVRERPAVRPSVQTTFREVTRPVPSSEIVSYDETYDTFPEEYFTSRVRTGGIRRPLRTEFPSISTNRKIEKPDDDYDYNYKDNIDYYDDYDYPQLSSDYYYGNGGYEFSRRAEDIIGGPYVKLECPANPSVCPAQRSWNLIICTNDSGCSQKEKCCYDSCSGKRLCKKVAV